MSDKHALLTARDIHGPYVQLLTNLQGENGREWLDALKKFLRKENPFPKSEENNMERLIITLSSQSVNALVRSGNYDWTSCLINDESFPFHTSLDGEWECDLWDPKGPVSSEDAKKACFMDGWMPATVIHLLAFGAKYPEIQRKNWIVGLGSPSCRSYLYRDVLVLNEDNKERRLSLVYWSDGWKAFCRFLRVRRLST